VFDGTNLGLGVTPSAWATSSLVAFEMPSGTALWRQGGAPNSWLSTNVYFNGTNFIYKGTAASSAYNQNSGQHIWYTAPSGTAGNAITFTQAMTLDASGNLLVGTTSNISGQSTSIQVENNNTTQIVVRNSTAAAGNWWRVAVDPSNTFYVLNQSTTGVGIASGGTSWNAVSDERLKTDLQPITNASQKVMSLRAVTGRYKTDEEGKSRSFLIAQDIEAVLPEAVSKSKLVSDAEDDTEYLSVSYTDTIPLLVAAIKEQQALIQSLTDRIAQLENKL
jgi:type IV secretory pathway VirB6-like protein